jgi:predicted DsbA family dithiol-disulfide isomerase
MHDSMYRNQHNIGRADLENYASQMGLDMTKFKAALDSQSHKPEVDADAKMAQDEGISGTPAFIINGYFVNGAQPYDKFKAAIDKALSEAK